MIHRILVSKKLLDGYKKRAIASYPSELLETLWGRIEGDTAIIERVLPVVQVASHDAVSADDEDILAPAKKARGVMLLGTIHSHPDSQDASPSEADWEDSYQNGEHVFAVCRITKKADKFITKISLWEARPIIKVTHPRTNRRKVTNDRNTTLRPQEQLGTERPAVQVEEPTV